MEQSPRPRRWSKPRRTRSRPKMFSKFFQEVLEGSKAPSSDSGVSSWRSDLTQAGSHFESWHALLGLDTLTRTWLSQVRSNKNQHRCGEKFFVQICSLEEKTFRHKILVRNFYFFTFLKMFSSLISYKYSSMPATVKQKMPKNVIHARADL